VIRRMATMLLLLSAAPAADARAVTWVVPSQCPTIQAGIDSASAGDTVLVACGTYYEHDILLKSGVVLRSETGNADCVTVDAQQRGEILRCEDCAALVRIEGLTVTRGYSSWQGGGVFCENSSVAFSGCRVSGNYSSYLGGGVYAESCSLVFNNCIMSQNSSGSSGGGVYCWDCALEMTDCTFSGNSGGHSGGGLCAQRGQLTRCTFSGNSARLADLSGGTGGGAWCGSALVTDCTFRDNSACALGGALGCYTAVVANSIFFHNSAGAGAGVYCADSAATLTSCTLSGNSAPGASGILAENSSVTMEKSIVAFGTGGEAVWCEGTASAQLSCCVLFGNGGGNWVGCISDLYPGAGNLASDPLFCDQDGGDLRPCASSPCLPENNTCGVLLGVLPLGECDCPVHVTHSVPYDYPSIAEALAAATYADTVLVHPGTYVENVVIPWGVALLSVSGSDSTTIDGRGGQTTVRISYEAGKTGSPDTPARLEGFTVTGATRTGVVVLACDPVITGCVVTGNSGLEGGGLSCYAASPRVTYCTVYGNQGSTWGGGFYCEGSSPTVENCTFSGNSAPEGGGIYSRSSRLSLANSVVVFSTAGEAVYCYGDTATLTCCDLFGNAGGDWVGAVENQYGSNGNISADPLFCDQDGGDLRLCASSSCLPENNNCGVLLGALPLGECDCPVHVTHSVPYDYPSISEALAVASYGDTVLVHPGIYEENILLPWGVTLLSTDGSDSTTIDGRGGTTTVAVSYEVSKPGGADTPARLEGFTITGATRTGIVVLACDPVIANCVITGNSGLKGGGLSCYAASPAVTYCTIHGNQGSTWGGGFYCEGSSPTVENCTFSGNSAPEGGGIYSRSSRLSLANSVVVFSTAGEAVYCYGDTATLTCCDLFGNAGGDWAGPVENQFGSNGNISADPLFCDQDGGDLRLDKDSPCAGGEGSNCEIVGAWGVGCSSTPPALAIGVFQDPLETQRLEVYMVCSDEVDSTSVIITVGSDTLDVWHSDSSENVWCGDYELVSSVESLSITGCAADGVGRDTCVAVSLSATLLESACGGRAMSPDERVRLFLSPRALGHDAYLLVLQGCAADVSPGRSLLGTADATLLWSNNPPTTSWPYCISPQGILTGPSATLEYVYKGTDLEHEPPDRLYLERVGGPALISLVDIVAGTISGIVSEFGVFRAAVGPAGSGTLRDRWFLQADQNYPNPFRRDTTIRFEIRDRQRLSVDVFDVRGRHVARILDTRVQPGPQEIRWDGRSDAGYDVEPGVYFCRIRGELRESIRKIILVR